MATQRVESSDAVFTGSDDISARCRALDWNATSLGPVEGWPPALSAAIRLCLDATRVPMAVWAGSDLVLIYNQDYASALGTRHPKALGRPARETFSEFWDRIGPELRPVLERGESMQRRDARFLVRRGDVDEEAFFSYSFTPIRDGRGNVMAALNILQDTTERVQSARRREDFLAFALSTARIGAWDLDLVDLTARGSIQHDRIFGYDEHVPHWTYERFLQHVVPEDRERVDRAFRHATEAGADWNFECRIKLPGGDSRWIWSAGRPFVEHGSRRRRMAGIVQDITERKQAEERLRISEARVKFAQQAAGAGIWHWDFSTGELEWSDDLYRIFGWDPRNDAPVTLEKWRSALHPEDKEYAETKLAESIASRGPLVSEHRIVLPSGEIRWVNALGRTVYDAAGHLQYVSGICLDTTERRRAEHALRLSEEKFAKAFHGSVAGMAMTRLADGLLLEVNDRFLDVTGFAREDAVGKVTKDLQIWKDPDDRDRFARTLQEHGTLQAEYAFVRPDGSEWVGLVSSQVSELDGEPIIISSIMDITERIRAEEALRRSEALARERLLELEALYETAPIGLCVFDEHLRWVRANTVIAEINGKPIEDHIGKTPRDIVPDVGEQAEEALRTILRTGERLDFEMTGTTAAQPGVERFWSEHWVPIKDPSGRITGISVAAEEITDRKRAAKALAESEEKFRTLADNIAQFAWTADETGYIFWYNKRWYDYTGTTLDDMKGWGWQKVHHPDHLQRVVEKIRWCFENGETWEDTFPLRGKDGSYRWFLSRAVPIRDGSGRVIRWFGTNTDITEQRAAEEALRLSERRYRTLAENAPEAITRFDRDQRVTYINEYGARFYGLARSEIVGRSIAELGMSPERAAFWKQRFAEATAAGGHRIVEFESVSPASGPRHFSTVLVPEYGEDFSILAITRDVTPLKLAENELRESAARFRRLADAMPQVVWTAAGDGAINYYNRRVDELFGIRQRDDGGWVWEDAVHPDDRPATLAMWAAALRDGTPYEITHRLRRSDGTLQWYLSRGIPVHGDDGRIVQWFGTTTNIDAQKRAEEALRDADHHKNEFLAMLSHELRNPFGVIRMSLGVMDRAGAESLQGRRALGVINRQVGHMARLLEDLLDVTRISKGKLRLQRESLELNGIVRTIGEDQAGMFERERINFRVVVPSRPIRVRVDGARIAQAIGNLLHNAAKFTSEGGQVTLSLGEIGGTEAILEVSDNGAGIPTGMLGRLFDPLMQAEHTIQRSRGGLGLGLPLVKGIVELHGGSVHASSEGPGCGAVFTIRLPLDQAAAGVTAGAATT